MSFFKVVYPFGLKDQDFDDPNQYVLYIAQGKSVEEVKEHVRKENEGDYPDGLVVEPIEVIDDHPAATSREFTTVKQMRDHLSQFPDDMVVVHHDNEMALDYDMWLPSKSMTFVDEKGEFQAECDCWDRFEWKKGITPLEVLKF